MIHLTKIKLALVAVLAIAICTSMQAIAGLPPAPDTGTPDGQRTPGGTRPGQTVACKQTDTPLTALVPENAKGFTALEYPSFWFYIPYTAKDIHAIEFSLHDRNETTTLYRTSLPLTKTPGVIGISLQPNSESFLQLNQSYHWYFKLNCEAKDNLAADDLVLDGWITRIQPSSNSVMWYDELANLAKSYASNPNNSEIKHQWERLLKSVGLESISKNND